MILRSVFQYLYPDGDTFLVWCRNERTGVYRELRLPSELFDTFIKWHKEYDTSLFDSLTPDEISLLKTGMTIDESLSNLVWEEK